MPAEAALKHASAPFSGIRAPLLGSRRSGRKPLQAGGLVAEDGAQRV